MNLSLIVIIGIAIISVIVALLAFNAMITVIRQGNRGVVERCGKYHRILTPGLNLILPWIDRVAHSLAIYDQALDIPVKNVVTKDLAMLKVDIVIYIQIIDPKKAVYAIDDYNKATAHLTHASLRALIGRMSLAEIIPNRESIQKEVEESIHRTLTDWGICLKKVEIEELVPSIKLQNTMAEFTSRELDRQVAIVQAETQKRISIIKSEGRVESANNIAAEKRILSAADRDSIETISKAIMNDRSASVYCWINDRFIQALESIAESGNSKSVVIPAELPFSIKTIMGSIESHAEEMNPGVPDRLEMEQDIPQVINSVAS